MLLNQSLPLQTLNGDRVRLIGKTLEQNLIVGVKKPDDMRETVYVINDHGTNLVGRLDDTWDVMNVPIPDEKVYGCLYRLGHGQIGVTIYDKKRDISGLSFLGQIELVFDGESGDFKSVKAV